MVTPPVPRYSLDDILDLEHKVLFVLGNSGEYYSTVWLFLFWYWCLVVFRHWQDQGLCGQPPAQPQLRGRCVCGYLGSCGFSSGPLGTGEASSQLFVFLWWVGLLGFLIFLLLYFIILLDDFVCPKGGRNTQALNRVINFTARHSRITLLLVVHGLIKVRSVVYYHKLAGV